MSQHRPADSQLPDAIITIFQQPHAIPLQDRPNSRLTEMYRHVGCVRDQRPVGVHQRATEVQPFLDVCRDGRLLQGSTHRFGYGHEAVGATIFVVVMSARMRARVVVGRERYQSAGRQEVSLIFDCDCSLGR
jgi:hypothetical protein